MIELSQQILEVIAVNPNIMAKNIAKKCSTSEELINRYLYGNLKDKVTATSCYQWSIKKIEEQSILAEPYKKRHLLRANDNKLHIKKINDNKSTKSKISMNKPFDLEHTKQRLVRGYLTKLRYLERLQKIADKRKSMSVYSLNTAFTLEKYGFEYCSNEELIKLLNDALLYDKERMQELGVSIEDYAAR